MRKEVALLKESLPELCLDAVQMLSGVIDYSLENFSKKEVTDFYKALFTDLIADLEAESDVYVKRLLNRQRSFLEELRLDERLKVFLVAKRIILQALTRMTVFAAPTAQRTTLLIESLLLEIAFSYEIELMKSETDDVLIADEIADELYKTRKKVEQQKKFITSIIENSPDAIVLLDSEWRVRLWNPAATALLGFKPISLIGKSIEKLAVYEGDIRSVLREVDKKGRLFGIDISFKTLDGGILHASLSLSTIDAQNPKDSAYMMVIRDASELRQMRDRVIDAERLSAMAKIAGAVAHEVRNPLNSLSLNLDLLSDTLLEETSPKARHHLRILREEIEKLGGIVTNYLSLSKLSKPEFKPYSIAQFLAHYCERFNEEHPTPFGGVRFINLLSTPDCELYLDSKQFTRVLDNLFHNAIEATLPLKESAGVYAPILTLRSTDEGIDIELEDSGEGLSAESLSNLFTPFFSTKSGGTGLGLYIVKEIITVHRGEIDIKNRNGTRGVSVLLHFPLPQTSASTPPLKLKSAASDKG